MSAGDVTALLAAFGDGTLLRPDPAEPNLVALSRAVTGLAGDTARLADPVADALAEQIGEHDHMVLFVADGFGRNFVEKMDDATICKRQMTGALRSAFPSSTGPNLTAIQTGLWPARHGFIGWRVHAMSLGEPIVPYPWVRVCDGRELAELGVDPDEIFIAPSSFDRCTRDVEALLPGHLSTTPASSRLVRSEDFHGYPALDAAVTRVIARVRSGGGPTFSYLYYPGVDGTAHAFGTTSPEVWAEIAAVEAATARLADELAGVARIIVTADHGHVDRVPAKCFRIDPDDSLGQELSAPPSGETHFLWFRVRAGRHGAFEEGFRARYGDDFFLLTTAEVEELELLGPGRVPDVVRERMGDFLALSRGEAAMDVVPVGRTGMLDLAATHGGLTPDEVEAPLILI